MKMRRAFSLILTIITILLLCLFSLALAACGAGDQAQQREEANPAEQDETQDEARDEAQGETQDEAQDEAQTEAQTGEEQAQQAAEEMAEIYEQFHGQVEIYPGALPDTSDAAAQARDAAGGDFILFTGHAPEKVVAFYDNSLKRIRDIEKEEAPSGVTYTFTDDRGESARIDIVQAGPSPQDGTYIIISIG